MKCQEIVKIMWGNSVFSGRGRAGGRAPCPNQCANPRAHQAQNAGRSWRRALLLCLFAACQPAAFGAADEAELVIRTKDGDPKTALRKALSEISRDQAVKALGQELYQRRQRQIQKAMLSGQRRFVLSSKVSKAEAEEDGSFASKVSISVSRENVKSFLLEKGLFYSSDAALCVLPYISFVIEEGGAAAAAAPAFSDKRRGGAKGAAAKQIGGLRPKGAARAALPTNKAAKANAALAAKSEEARKASAASVWAADFYRLLSRYSLKAGLWGRDPARLQTWLPASLLAAKGKTADFLKCHIIMEGKASAKKREGGQWTARFQLKTWNAKTRAALFETDRLLLFQNPKTEGGKGARNNATRQKRLRGAALSAFSHEILKNWSARLKEINMEGGLELRPLFLGVQGPLSFADKEAFMKALLAKVPQIKNPQRVYVSSQKTIYKVKARGEGSFLKLLRETDMPGFRMLALSQSGPRIELYAKKAAPRKPL